MLIITVVDDGSEFKIPQGPMWLSTLTCGIKQTKEFDLAIFILFPTKYMNYQWH